MNAGSAESILPGGPQGDTGNNMTCLHGDPLGIATEYTGIAVITFQTQMPLYTYTRAWGNVHFESILHGNQHFF